METCECGGGYAGKTAIFMLECLDCAGCMVKCPACGKLLWWSSDQRKFALTACETHRWETGHTRVVVRGFGRGHHGEILREVDVEVPSKAA